MLEDHSIPDARSYRGHEGIADWWRALEHNWADLEVNPERFIHDRGDVAVLLRVSGRGRASGVPVEGEFGGLLKVRNGLVVKLEIYAGWDAVLKAWELHQREADAAA